MSELSPMPRYNSVTVIFLASTCHSFFDQLKWKGISKDFVDLSPVKHLKKHDYREHNTLVTTISDDSQRKTGWKYFCELEERQAYHYLHLTDQLSVHLIYSNMGQ